MWNPTAKEKGAREVVAETGSTFFLEELSGRFGGTTCVAPDITRLEASDFKRPAISLSGVVDHDMYRSFRTQYDTIGDRALVVVEMSTLGGDPEVARMLGEDIRFAGETEPQRPLFSSAKPRFIRQARLS